MVLQLLVQATEIGLWELKDWIAVSLAALALLVSLIVAGYTIRAERKMAQMATYERLHEQLVSPQTATGRRAIFLHSPTSAFPTPCSAGHQNACDCGHDPDLWDVMNQAVAWYDTLGTYYRQRQVPRKVVLRAWYHPLIAIRPHIYRFLDHRVRQGIEQPWDSLQSLLELTLWYRCTCRTCTAGHRPAAQLQPSEYVCECSPCAGKSRMRPAIRTAEPRWISILRVTKRGKSWAGLGTHTHGRSSGPEIDPPSSSSEDKLAAGAGEAFSDLMTPKAIDKTSNVANQITDGI